MQQARAPQTRPFGPEAFAPTGQTVLRWLGMAGFLLSSAIELSQLLFLLLLSIFQVRKVCCVWLKSAVVQVIVVKQN